MGRETTRKPPEAGCRLGGPARGLGLGSLSLANLNLKHVLLGIQKNVQTGLLTVQKTVNLWRSTRVIRSPCKCSGLVAVPESFWDSLASGSIQT